MRQVPRHDRRLAASASLLVVSLTTACPGERERPPAGQPSEAATGQQPDQPPPMSSQALVTTDRDSYQVRRTGDALQLEIVATFTNRTADTVYLHPCGRVQPSFTLEKWVGGQWRPAYGPPCPAILMLNPPAVAPGASRTDTVLVSAALSPNAMPRFEFEPAAGTYRLVYVQAYGSWRPNEGPGELLPVEQRVSAPFRIEE